MTVLDVYLNDRKVCRAGVGATGVLDAMISWVKLSGAAADTARRLGQPVEEARLSVGGLRRDAHLSWCDRRLRIGDRVGVVIARAGGVDSPTSERRRERGRTPPVESRATRFLNVDLDVWSSSPLDSLVAAFGRRVTVLHVGREGRRHGAHLELAAQIENPDRLLRRFVDLVNGLPRPARQAWNRARAREFNIGIQAAARPHSFELRLAPDTLTAVASVRARIAMTVYAADADAVTRR